MTSMKTRTSFPVSLFGVGDKLMNIMNPREGVEIPNIKIPIFQVG